MSARSAARRSVLLVVVLIPALAFVPPGGRAGAQTCPDVVLAARATSTVGRGDAANGAALAAPAYYSQLIYDSIPAVAYNQSGPSTTGQLEDPTGTNPQTLVPTAFGFLPVDAPVADPELFPDGTPFIPAPPIVGRAEAAYPTLQGIPQDSTSSAGPSTAEAHAYPTYSQGRASGSGLGGPDGGFRSGSAFTVATLECGTLTMVVGWEATGVLTPGGTIPSMSQVATLVVSPTGATAQVATNVAEETEEGVPVIEGRALDPVFDPFNANGTYVDIGEPRVTIEDGYARVEGGGIRYGTVDPSRNDTYTFVTIGSLDGEVRFVSELPALPPAAAGTTPPVEAGPVEQTTAATAPDEIGTVVVEQVGEAPEPSAVAQEFAAAQVQLAGVTSDLTTGSLSLWPAVLGILAAALIARVGWRTADRGRDRLPTAGFAVDWLRLRGRRFGSTYLEW